MLPDANMKKGNIIGIDIIFNSSFYDFYYITITVVINKFFE